MVLSQSQERPVTESQLLTERIQQHWHELPAAERRVAQFVASQARLAATYSLTELSQIHNVSKATVSRLFRRLGYSDFNSARDAMRQQPNPGSPLARPITQADDLYHHVQQETSNLSSWLSETSLQDSTDVIDLLFNAQTLYCVGLRNNYALALHAHTQWAQLRASTQLVPQPGQSLSEQLAALRETDVVVIFGFRRRYQGFQKLLKTLTASPAKIVLITEPDFPTHTSMAAQIQLPIESQGPFASYAAPVSWIAHASNGMMHHFPTATRQRIEQIERQYQELGELEP
jgi:DNA-binding MurR/RpiR family transcriptional regulator